MAEHIIVCGIVIYGIDYIKEKRNNLKHGQR